MPTTPDPSPWLDEWAWLPEAGPRHLPASCDVAIVGGGVMGLSVAYWLAGPAVRVVLFESGRIGMGASGRNAGLVLAGGSMLESPGHLLSLLDREGIDAAYERTGHLAIAASPDVFERMHDERLRRSPDAPALMVLDRSECEDLLQTRLAAHLRGGRWYPGGAVVHPGRLLRGLAAAAVRRGAHLAEATMVRRIRPVRGQDDVDVETSRGSIRARHVVVAANAGTGRLIPSLARVFRPARGQMLATRPAQQTFRPAMAIDWGTMYWRQTADGAIVLGGCSHLDPAAEHTRRERLNPRIQAALPAALSAAFPDLPPIHVARRWAGIMDCTVDGRPLVGRTSSAGNRWVVAGFGGHGLPPAIGTGRAVAEAIATGRLPEIIDRFNPRRFAPARTSVRAAVEAS